MIAIEMVDNMSYNSLLSIRPVFLLNFNDAIKVVDIMSYNFALSIRPVYLLDFLINICTLRFRSVKR